MALLEIPSESRAAICLGVRVVSPRNHAAGASLARSFLGREFRSVALYPRVANSCAMMRSAWAWPNGSSAP